jgi:hypothetical protein
VNNDKSLYSNLFCKQLLCHDKIIEFLLNNYVLWAWDVTFQSNGEKYEEIFIFVLNFSEKKSCYLQHANELINLHKKNESLSEYHFSRKCQIRADISQYQHKIEDKIIS